MYLTCILNNMNRTRANFYFYGNTIVKMAGTVSTVLQLSIGADPWEKSLLKSWLRS